MTPSSGVSLGPKGELQALFGRNEVIEVYSVRSKVDLDPTHLAAELFRRRIVVGHRRAEFVADIAGLIGREYHGLRHLHPAFADFAAVHVERDRASFREPAAVVLELHPNLMSARRDRRGALDRVPVHAVKVIAVFRLASLGVEAPAADDSAKGDDDAFGAGRGHDNL